MTDPLISVVIPIKNERASVRACIEGIRSQTLADSLEIIFVDSGSTDGSLEILAEYPVTVHRIPSSEFNHGETRNLGVRLARGQFVALTVADARPVDNSWLERMLTHFEDPKVAGVCGQQVVPHELDKNPLQWFRPYSQPVPRKIQFADPAEFKQLPPAQQLDLCRWDDVTSMYRRSALLEQPFQRVGFSEDQIWAKGALARGWALVYEPRAQVAHYHNESFSFNFRRTFTIQYFNDRFFGCRRSGQPLLLSLTRAVYHLGKATGIPWHNRTKWLLYNFRLILADWLARYWFSVVLRWRGRAALDRVHERLCGKPPQPVAASRIERRYMGGQPILK